MFVRDIMAKEFHCASPRDSVSDVAQAMKRHNVGAIPVCEDVRLVGIVTDRDIAIECVAAGLDPKIREIQEFMTANPLTISPGTSLEEAANLMGTEQVRRLPVVEGGRLVGMISAGDIAIHLKDDSAVAAMVRRISIPVRTTETAAAAGGSASPGGAKRSR